MMEWSHGKSLGDDVTVRSWLFVVLGCAACTTPEDKSVSSGTDPTTVDSGAPATTPDPPIEDSGCVELTSFADVDADGFGDPGAPTEACEVPSGHVTNDADCDDTRADVHPDAPEVCDASDTDEDCDGLADDLDDSVDLGTAAVAHVDSDGDGFGGSTTVAFCDVPDEGYTTTATDCDDTDASVHPGADEVCDDALDNDCDLDVDEGCGIAGLSDAVAFIEGAGDGFGTRVAGADLTGDGIGDLVVGVYIAGSDYEGRALVFAGPLSGQLDVTSAVGQIDGTVSEGALGYAFETTEDADGDGVADLFIGALGLGGAAASSPGTAYLVTDVPVGPLVVPDDAHAWFVGEDNGDNAGASADDVGDVNGDGHIDFVVGAGQAADYGGGTGHVYLMHGPVSGAYDLASDADTTLYCSVWAGGMADTLTSGDLTGDGLSDLVLAANSSSYTGVVDGAVFIVSDPDLTAMAVETDADAMITGSTYLSFGQVATAGDFTGDGYLDLAVSDGASPGTVWVMPGPFDGASTLSGVHTVIDGLGTYLLDQTGFVIETTDLNHDSAADLAIASPHVDVTSTGPGAVDIFYGPLAAGTVDLTAADVALAGTGSDMLGAEAQAVFDTTGDGLDELVVGASVWSGGLGAVWVMQ